MCPGDVQTAAHVRVLPRPALHPQRPHSHPVLGLLLDRHSSCAGARHPRSAHRAHHHHVAVGRHQQTAEVILRLLAFDALNFQIRDVTLACRVSYIKSVDVWMFTCMIFVFGALIEYCVVNVLARRHKVIRDESKLSCTLCSIIHEYLRFKHERRVCLRHALAPLLHPSDQCFLTVSSQCL